MIEIIFHRLTITFLMIDSPDEYIQLTLHEFLMGKKGEYRGIMPVINKYIWETYKSKDSKNAKSCKKYIAEHIVKRASGETPTPAKWMRDFVLNHPAYKKDSIVSEVIFHMNQMEQSSYSSP